MCAGLGLELIRSYGVWDDAQPAWVAYTALATIALPLVFRRRHPLLVAGYAALHMGAVGIMVPELSFQIAMQVAYFYAVYCAVAWSRDRRLMLVVLGGILLLWLAWLAWDVAYGQAVEIILAESSDRSPPGILPPLAAVVIYSALVTLAFLVGAVLLGQTNWRAARERTLLVDQAATIERQAATLRDQAVVDERLRIARELHDVVAHHVSVIGVQAGAARRVLTRDPDAAASALLHVEESSRSAVTEMRSLLGTLRGSTPDTADDRAPEPTASDIARLVESFAEPGFAPTLSIVTDAPDALADLPLPVGLSLFRTVQEALTNVRKHSTATAASVTLRVDRDGNGRYAEAEVLDDGRPRPGTSGSGLGHLGMRERISSHGGTAEIGPRLTGGYRVRVRFPVKEAP